MKKMQFRSASLALLILAGLSSQATLARATGIPLDSDYLIFVVDTSPSMQRYAWDRVRAQIEATLDAHPELAGIQVLNDEGRPLFGGSAGEWLPDTSEVRESILDNLDDWESFSNSSPRNGILDALETYYDPDKRISLFVYSDDFSTGSGAIETVVREVDERNRSESGGRRMRIHAVAFPVYFDETGSLATSADYARLMRAIAQRNGGSFVALPSRRVSDGSAVAEREPMTGLRVVAGRTLILIDSSRFMAGERWQQAIDTVADLTGSLGPGAQLQLVAFGAEARVVSGDDAGRWIDIGDDAQRARALAALAELVPAGESSLESAMRLIGAEASVDDDVYLLTGGLPTVDSGALTPAATERDRYDLFLRAARESPRDIPISVLLMGDDSDTQAAPAYWSLALATGGSLLAPASDWP